MPEPDITAVYPTQGANNIPVTMDIYGSNLGGITAVSLHNTQNQTSLENIKAIDNTHVRGTVPMSVATGTYSVTISSLTQTATLSNAYQVLVFTAIDDLYAASFDLWHVPRTIHEGDTITPRFGLRVHRQGGLSPLVAGVHVDFYQGNPTDGGSYLGRGTVAALAPYDAASTGTVNWSPLPPAGLYTMYALIDPDNIIAENNEQNNMISRTIRILPMLPDLTPPVIDSFQINSGSQSTHSRPVYLNTTAHDNMGGSGIANILTIEYEYIQSAGGWIPVAISDWLPFATAGTNYAWTIQPEAGIHYIQVWAADKAGNISPMPMAQLINYLPTTTHLSEGQIYLYRYILQEGQTIDITLTAGSLNDADLYLWKPDDAAAGVRESDDPDRHLIYTVQAGEAGVFQIEVEGQNSTDYQMTVSIDGAVEAIANHPLRVTARSAPYVSVNDTPAEVNVGLPGAPEEYAHLYLPFITR